VNPHSWRSARGIALAFVLSAASIARGFDLQGHRGARGLAPENTLIGFHRALAEGVSTLELDIGVTRDGIAVIHHDNALNPNLTRGENGTWIATPIPIRSLDLRELRRFDVGRMQPGSAYAARYPQQQAHDGQTVPTLDELFRMIRARGDDTVRFNIETKISLAAVAWQHGEPAANGRRHPARGQAAGNARSRQPAVVRLAHPGLGTKAAPALAYGLFERAPTLA